MIPAVAYARYSSDMQREESIEAQLKYIYEYAEKKGIVIIKEYIDRGISGKRAEDRTAFLQMIKDAKQGNFQLVLVHKSNRFARNREESAIYKHKLRKNGVKVVAVAQDFGEGPHTVIMEALMEGLDEFYSLELANETMKGLLVNAEQCKYNGGHILFGYKVNENKLYEIEPAEAEIVRDIFHKIADGWSYVEVLRYLDETGKRNRKGNKFGKNSIHDMLRNERYTGTYIFNKSPRRDNLTGKRTSRIKKPDEEIIRIENGMPQIIDRETWDKVQRIMDNRKFQTRPVKRKFLLTGFIECGLCGSAYVGSTTTNKYVKKGYYICTRKKTKADCKNQNISQEKIESRVIEEIKSMLSDIDISELTKLMNKTYAELTEDIISERELIQKEIISLDKKINNLLDAIEEGNKSEIIKQRLNKHVSRKNEIRNKAVKFKNKGFDFYRRYYTESRLNPYPLKIKK
jgi:Site-specific recombinases, DNA invertase Pin homologs